MKFISFKDPSFKFSGVWQESGEDEVVSYGTVSFAEIGFEGNELEVIGYTDKNVYFYVDGESVTPEKTENGYKFALDSGKHTLKISSRDIQSFHFKGIFVSDNAELFVTPKKPYVHFIGDSITCAYPGYASASAMKLGVDFSVVAKGGMSLVDGWGWYKPYNLISNRHGMESVYFGLETMGDTPTLTPYKFEYLRIPDIVVIFLGTNDYLDCQVDEVRGNIDIFAKHYLGFVKKIRALYPDAPILMLQALSDKYCRRRGIDTAFELISKEVDNVALVPSHEWDVELIYDITHPSEQGYAYMGDRMAEVLEKEIEKLDI